MRLFSTAVALVASLTAPTPAAEVPPASLPSIDVAYLSFPVRVDYLVSNPGAGTLAAGHRALSSAEVPPLVTIIEWRSQAAPAVFGFFDRALWGFGVASNTYTAFDRAAEVTGAPAAGSKNATNVGDSLSVGMASFPLYGGWSRSFSLAGKGGDAGFVAGFWFTHLQTLVTEARWYGAETTPVELVTRDNRFLTPIFAALTGQLVLLSAGSYHLGITGRVGYSAPMEFGTDPNPLVDRVGVAPGSLGEKLTVGGMFWTVGLKLL